MKKKILLILTLLIFLAAGCGGTQSSPEDLAFDNAVNTAVAETLVASLQDGLPQTAASAPASEVAAEVAVEAPAAAQAAQAPAPVVSAFEAETEQDAGAQAASVPAFAEEAAAMPPAASGANVDDDGPPCYSAALVAETIPDGSVFHPGDGFAKSWTIKNTGSCEWGGSFRFVWVSGNTYFHASQDSKLTSQSILPGQTVTVTLEMGAPVEPGHYIAFYQIYNENGVQVTHYGVWVSIWVDYD